MFSYRKTSDVAFVQAVLCRDDTVIKAYYRESCLPMAVSLAKRFPGVSADLISSAVNDALITVISQYVETKKIYVKGGKMAGTKRGKLAPLIAYIARCEVIRHLKWVKKYGTSDINDYLIKLKGEESNFSEEENNQANMAVMKAFRSLNEKCQKILTCRLIHGMSYKEIVNEGIGVSVESLRVEAHRCIKYLRARYLRIFFTHQSIETK